MSKFVVTDYSNKIEILKFPDHYVTIGVTVDDAGIVANADGKKIVPAGTIVGNALISVLVDNTVKVSELNGAGADGVLLDDVDVTYGPASGAMIVHGFVATDKLPAAPNADAITALKGRIIFIK
jgi:hypothetical protein